MIGRIILGLSIFCMFSCRDEISGLKAKDNIVPKDTLVMILKDMTLLESHIQLKYIQVNRYHKTMKKSGDVVLKKYNVTPSRYEASMDYYGSRQVEMQSIYSQVLDSLNRMANQIVVSDTLPKEAIKEGDAKLPGFVKIKLPK